MLISLLQLEILSFRCNGPAVTLKVRCMDRDMSIDLVPVFEMPFSALPTAVKKGHAALDNSVSIASRHRRKLVSEFCQILFKSNVLSTFLFPS